MSINNIETKDHNSIDNTDQLKFFELYSNKLRDVYKFIISVTAIALPYLSDAQNQNNDKAQQLFETLDSQGNKSFSGDCSKINISLSDSVTFMRKNYLPDMPQGRYRVMALKWTKDNQQIKDIYFIDPKTKTIYSQLDPNGNSSRNNCLWSEIEKEIL